MDGGSDDEVAVEAEPSPSRARRWGRRSGIAAAVVVALFALTFVTGCPVRGPLQRYPVRDLQQLADEINAAGGCSAGVGPLATVDLVRSRVVLHGATWSPLPVDERPMVLGASDLTLVSCDPG